MLKALLSFCVVLIASIVPVDNCYAIDPVLPFATAENSSFQFYPSDLYITDEQYWIFDHSSFGDDIDGYFGIYDGEERTVDVV